VFAATQDLLAERGPRGFSLVDVAEHAGVAPSSLYRRWCGAEALIM
jgi:AcrR family transcriptional regulator